MPQIIYSRQAENDLGRLFAFLEPKSADVALRATRKIAKAIGQLSNHPRLGRAAVFNTDYCELIVPWGRSAYIVLYEVKADIRILAIRHGREAGYAVLP